MNYGHCSKHDNEQFYTNWCQYHKPAISKLANGRTQGSCRSCQYWQIPEEEKMTKEYRLYYGYDCNSIMGFNNGHYLDDAGIFHDEDDARKYAEEFFILKGEWDNCDPDAYHVITGYYDKYGNRIEEEEYDNDLDHSYSYQYISVEEEYNGKTRISP